MDTFEQKDSFNNSVGNWVTESRKILSQDKQWLTLEQILEICKPNLTEEEVKNILDTIKQNKENNEK